MSKGRIYIAGPMTGLPEYNFPAFNAAAERLRADGWDVINPVEIVEKHGGAREYEQSEDARSLVSREEYEGIMTSDALYLLKGWQRSTGTQLELLRFLTNKIIPCRIILEGSEVVK